MTCCDEDCKAARIWAAQKIAELEADVERLRLAMREVCAHAHVAVTQSVESDDQIMIGHLMDIETTASAAIAGKDNERSGEEECDRFSDEPGATAIKLGIHRDCRGTGWYRCAECALYTGRQQKEQG